MHIKESLVNFALGGMGDDRLKKFLKDYLYQNPGADLVIFKHDLSKAIFTVLDNWSANKKSPHNKELTEHYRNS